MYGYSNSYAGIMSRSSGLPGSSAATADRILQHTSTAMKTSSRPGGIPSSMGGSYGGLTTRPAPLPAPRLSSYGQVPGPPSAARRSGSGNVSSTAVPGSIRRTSLTGSRTAATAHRTEFGPKPSSALYRRPSQTNSSSAAYRRDLSSYAGDSSLGVAENHESRLTDNGSLGHAHVSAERRKVSTNSPQMYNLSSNSTQESRTFQTSSSAYGSGVYASPLDARASRGLPPTHNAYLPSRTQITDEHLPPSRTSHVETQPPATPPLPSLAPSTLNGVPPALPYVGLENPGVLCYQNSCLQVFAHLPGFAQVLRACQEPRPQKAAGGFLARLSPSKSRDSRPWTAALNQFLDSVEDAKSGSSIGGEASGLRAVRDMARRYSRRFSGRTQEDAHEFMNTIIDCIKDECGGTDSALFRRVYGSTVRICECRRCGHHSKNIEPMPFFQVNFSDSGYRSSGSYRLEDLLVNSIHSGDEMESYECDMCKPKKPPGRTCIKIDTLPDIMCVHLLRFRHDGYARKVKARVTCPPQWTLDSHQGPRRYECVATVSHLGGGANSGHYYSHVKCSDGVWRQFDDRRVSTFSGDLRGHLSDSEEVYMVFYRAADVSSSL